MKRTWEVTFEDGLKVTIREFDADHTHVPACQKAWEQTGRFYHMREIVKIECIVDPNKRRVYKHGNSQSEQ